MPGLLDRRLIFVTGKGGVGKTTVAEALGRVAAAHGRSTVVAAMAASTETAGNPVVNVAPGLDTIEIDTQTTMEEYLRTRVGPIGSALGHSRLFGALAMATPGLREMLAIGKIWEMTRVELRGRRRDVYDLVIVDAPATGHGVGVLQTPGTYARMARVGPIANQAATVAGVLADSAFTAIVAVTLAEEMPVRETLALDDTLTADGLALDLVVLNGREPERFSTAELARIDAALTDPGLGETARGALAAARSSGARVRAQAGHVERLGERFGDRLVSLPHRYGPELGADELAELADTLEGELSGAGHVGARR